MDITKLYQTQVSLTEWLEKIGHPDTAAMRIEDNNKRERLKIIKQIIDLPFDEPTQFSAREVADQSPGFQEFLKMRGHELCALRLIPLKSDLPKLRMRGQSVRDVLVWFAEQKIDPNNYKADFVPHTDENKWSTIFVVNENGIFGEIIRGGHHQLTQGFYTDHQPVAFSFDWNEWHCDTDDSDNREALEHLRAITDYLKVTEKAKQKLLDEKLNAEFAHDYLLGYFETVTTDEFGIWFIDYNRILGKMYDDFSVAQSTQTTTKIISQQTISGQIGNPGIVLGKVRIVELENIATTDFKENEILVCDMTTPEYISLMQKSAGVITNRGGILSHAAIVCRELKKPCLVGTKNATAILKTGDEIELDANKNIIKNS